MTKTSMLFPDLKKDLSRKVAALKEASGERAQVLWGILLYQAFELRDQLRPDRL